MKLAVFILGLILLFPVQAISATEGGKSGAEQRIRITFDNHEVVIKMLDNEASKDFMALLPLNLDFADYAGQEKIAYLPRKLKSTNSASAREFSGCDFTYFVPWGNLAVFYEGVGTDGSLYMLGRIESGKKELAKMKGKFNGKIELIK